MTHRPIVAPAVTARQGDDWPFPAFTYHYERTGASHAINNASATGPTDPMSRQARAFSVVRHDRPPAALDHLTEQPRPPDGCLRDHCASHAGDNYATPSNQREYDLPRFP